MEVQKIIQKFGKQEAVAAIAGVGQSAVSEWVRNSSIPHKRQARLLKEAKRLNIDLQPSDFFDGLD